MMAVPLPLVYVVTVTWNGKADTLQCLESLRRMTYPNFRLLVVDNGSQDDTVDVLRSKFPQVELLANATNLGFSGGFNLGLRHAMAQGAGWLLIINNDTLVAPDLLVELMGHATDPAIGMLAPKIYSMSEPNRIWSVGGRRSRWTTEMVDGGHGQVDAGQWEVPLPRDYFTGCALLLSRALLEDVGLFDAERFSPAYYEDSDLCVRARQAGWRLLLVPSAHVWHKGAASSGGNDSPQERYLMARNSVRFFRKHIRGWRWAIVFPYRLASAMKTTLRLTRDAGWRSIGAHWRGLLDGLRQPF
jgi:GT2 family glycosyltransferase